MTTATNNAQTTEAATIAPDLELANLMHEHAPFIGLMQKLEEILATVEGIENAVEAFPRIMELCHYFAAIEFKGCRAQVNLQDGSAISVKKYAENLIASDRRGKPSVGRANLAKVKKVG